MYRGIALIREIKPETLYFKGDSRAVILLHAYTGTPNDVRILGRRLNQAGYSVYMPMFTGHGTSNPMNVLKKGNVSAWWSDTKNAITFLKNQHKTQISIFGLSLGGIFAMKALEIFPELKNGGVFCSPLYVSNFDNVKQAFREYITKIDSYQNQPESICEQHLREFEELAPTAMKNINQESIKITQNLNLIHQQIFIGQGEADKMIDHAAAYKLAATFPKEQVDFHMYKNAGHIITLNHARKQLEQDLLRFLEI